LGNKAKACGLVSKIAGERFANAPRSARAGRQRAAGTPPRFKRRQRARQSADAANEFLAAAKRRARAKTGFAGFLRELAGKIAVRWRQSIDGADEQKGWGYQ
jgi:hypothetical protein